MNSPSDLPESVKALRVMMVDDDEFMLSFVEEILQDLGVRHLTRAVDGRAALASIDGSAELPQLLICDLNMPGMDGIEFFRHLAGRRYEGGVILSSSSDRNLLKSVELLLQAHGLMFLGTLQKPARKEYLLSLLIKFIEVAPRRDLQKIVKMMSPEEIRESLDTGQMEVYFQPKIRIYDKRVMGAESLVRCNHPKRGLILPNSFISVAEEYGLIDSLTMLVFRESMRQAALWNREGHNLKVSVNVSMDNLDRLTLPEEFAEIAERAGVDVGQVTLEMTESHLIKNMATSLEIITRLRLKGFNLSIDDFGTGYSSMEKLNQLPFTELKVDRAFVFGAAKDASARAILELSVKTGKTLGMLLVAEGVETEEDWDLVDAVGCDEVQGFFVAKAMPAQEFLIWKKRWDEQYRKI
ncbi:MAG TPA: EAL domain-containing response regulator [Methylophilaceae bacterium]|jgi:EAL domain-containing protein (putative c-di-GMP-specific phosphodiesterase class I)